MKNSTVNRDSRVQGSFLVVTFLLLQSLGLAGSLWYTYVQRSHSTIIFLTSDSLIVTMERNSPGGRTGNERSVKVFKVIDDLG